MVLFSLGLKTTSVSHQRQRVVIKGYFSNWNLLKSSVPQGSILGPILIFLYINDFPNARSHCTLAMFADDSESLKVFQNVNCSDFTAIQGDLDGLTNKSLTNEIYLQPPKCLNLRISRKQITHTIAPLVFFSKI